MQKETGYREPPFPAPLGAYTPSFKRLRTAEAAASTEFWRAAGRSLGNIFFSGALWLVLAAAGAFAGNAECFLARSAALTAVVAAAGAFIFFSVRSTLRLGPALRKAKRAENAYRSALRQVRDWNRRARDFDLELARCPSEDGPSVQALRLRREVLLDERERLAETLR